MLTERQIKILKDSFQKLLGSPIEEGAVTYTKCLSTNVINDLCRSKIFDIKGWRVFGVTDHTDFQQRLIRSDNAVEIREEKADAVLLLIDTAKAGSGLDGIFSAGREIKEADLFNVAIKIAQDLIPRGFKGFCKKAVSKARRIASVSFWREFEFYSNCEDAESISQALTILYLWPIYFEGYPNDNDLDKSYILIQRFFMESRSNLTIEEKINSLLLKDANSEQRLCLSDFLRTSIGRNFKEALENLKTRKELWLNNLNPGIFDRQDISHIEIVSWRGKDNTPLKWSGLQLNNHGGLQFNLNPQAKLEIRWRSVPEELEKDVVQYNVTIKAGVVGEILSEKTISHNDKKFQKCIFMGDDFQVDDTGIFEARVHITVIGKPDIEAESEDFLIQHGETNISKAESSARAYRALIEGAIQIQDKDDFIRACSDKSNFTKDKKGYIVFRHENKAARVECPPLISMIDNKWNGEIGRWSIQIRADGTMAGDIKFIPIDLNDDRFKKASSILANYAKDFKGIMGLMYISKETKDRADEYVNAWLAATENNKNKDLALINTLEVKTLSDKTIGLIVLPSHPMMIAWHSAYDQLLAYFRYDYEQRLKPQDILALCKCLDGAYFPAFLPGIKEDESFVFGDTIGFYSSAMTLDSDREPKASIAMLAKAFFSEREEASPTIGKTTSDALAEEIYRYIILHPNYRKIHIHAIRPGDGMTIGRALGTALDRIKKTETISDDENHEADLQINFALNLYPAIERQGITGRFFQSVNQRRRTGSGVSEQDLWIFENLLSEGNIPIPRLSWAKMDKSNPSEHAHIAVAFDTFESKVLPFASNEIGLQKNSPIESFGLHPSLIRSFSFTPSPVWKTYLPINQDGEKHPASRGLTERLFKIQSRLMRFTAMNLGGSVDSIPVLVTEIQPEKEESISSLHSLTDWVITIDKNAGIEYFDSPREKPKVFEAYIIDCVPEKEDLGFLQMVTSTTNLEEISYLLDASLDEMGLSTSPDNCIFLLNELKALSGRFALRLAGQGYKPQEMIALSIIHANCILNRIDNKLDDKVWLSLRNGFFVPLDEVPYLLSSNNNEDNSRADLLYVTAQSRGGLQFAFVEVKFRRNLKTARSLDVINECTSQLRNTRRNWEALYGERSSPLEKAIRYSRLARALKFYANKGRRHYLNETAYEQIIKEIDKMVSEGSRYNFPISDLNDRAYIFCPEYNAQNPSLVSFDENPSIYLIGNCQIPDRLSRQRLMEFKSSQHKQSFGNINGESKTENEYPVLNQDISEIEKPSDKDKNDLTKQNIVKTTSEGISSKEDVSIHIGDTISSQEQINWNISIRANPHLLLVGLPGMGKTTSLINICVQMFKKGITPIIFSYHNDIDERLLNIFYKDLQFIDYNGLGFNPLEVISDSPVGFIDNVSMIRDIFGAIFSDLGDIQLGRIREALKQSYLDIGWDINRRDIEGLKVPEFDAFYYIIKNTQRQDKSDKGLLLRLEELNDYGFFNTYHEKGSIFSFKKPVVIRIHKTQNEVLQKAFSVFILHHLYKHMFIRGQQKEITHAIIFDEAHRAAKLKLIPTMAKECRKFGISFILASQEIRDFDPSVYNAIANYLIMRLNENDARAISKIIAPSDQIKYYTDKIKQMQKYHAFFFGEGIQKARFIKLLSLET